VSELDWSGTAGELGWDAEPLAEEGPHVVSEPAAPPRPRSRERDHLRVALRSRGTRRRAVLLREVLGPPVALRDPTIDRPT
jgi:hypothetical protein